MNEKRPKVSVLLSVHNHEKYVGQAIESVLRQAYQDWELIIIDDGSQDHSPDVVRQYQDERIRFYRSEENRGAILTFNDLLKKANGEYIACLDSDDIWHDGKLEEQIGYLEQHQEIAACFTWAEFIDEEGALYSVTKKECDCDINLFLHEERTQAQCLRYFFDNGNYLCRSSVAMRTAVAKELGGFDPKFRALHDYEYWVRLIHKYPVHMIQKPCVQYRRVSVDNNSLSAANRKNTIRLLNEYQMIVYTMIKEMDKQLFCKAFQDLLKKEVTDDTHLLCEKYFVLLNWTLRAVNNRQPAIRFFHEFMDESAVECLQQDYRYSWQDYYKEMEETWQSYPIDFYKSYRDLAEENSRLQKECRDLWQGFEKSQREVRRLIRELQGMSQTISWKLTQPLRTAKRFVSGKRH